MTLWQLYAGLGGSAKNWDVCRHHRLRPGPTHTSALTRTLSGYAETVGQRLGFFDHTGFHIAIIMARRSGFCASAVGFSAVASAFAGAALLETTCSTARTKLAFKKSGLSGQLNLSGFFAAYSDA